MVPDSKKHAPRGYWNSHVGCVTWSIHSTQKINDMNYNQFFSDLSTNVKKLKHRSDDLVFLRHNDHVVGTGPEKLFMSDGCGVLREECDTVNFFHVLRSLR